MTEADLLEALERWRKQHNLKKTDVSRLLGLKSSQAYGNWIRRASLPKGYGPMIFEIISAPSYERADALMRQRRRRHPEAGAMHDAEMERLLADIDPASLAKPKDTMLRDRAASAARKLSHADKVSLIIEFLDRIDLTDDDRAAIARALFRQ